MAAGISSLDIALRRIESIEKQFNVLSGVPKINQPKPDTDFENILNSNMQQMENVNNKSVQEKQPTKSRAEIENLIEKYAQKNDLDKDFVKAVIKQESGFNTKAKSHCGAMGLMQLMPATARGLGVKDAYNPVQNVDGGVRYLKNLLSKYNNLEYEVFCNIKEEILNNGDIPEDVKDAYQKFLSKELNNDLVSSPVFFFRL